jgi:hypothetical protein
MAADASLVLDRYYERTGKRLPSRKPLRDRLLRHASCSCQRALRARNADRTAKRLVH